MRLKSVRVPKAAELVADEIRRHIVRGELKDGDVLPPEGELLEQLGVSRPVLKEALRILGSEGLLSIRQGARSGTVVTHPSIQTASSGLSVLFRLEGGELADVIDASAVVEAAAALHFAERCGPEALSRLRDTCDREATAMRNPADRTRASLEFHAVVLEGCDLPALRLCGLQLQELWLQSGIVELSELAVEADRPIFLEALGEHGRFIELVTEGKPADAADLWRRHLETTAEMVRRMAHADRSRL